MKFLTIGAMLAIAIAIVATFGGTNESASAQEGYTPKPQEQRVAECEERNAALRDLNARFGHITRAYDYQNDCGPRDAGIHLRDGADVFTNGPGGNLVIVYGDPGEECANNGATHYRPADGEYASGLSGWLACPPAEGADSG